MYLGLLSIVLSLQRKSLFRFRPTQSIQCVRSSWFTQQICEPVLLLNKGINFHLLLLLLKPIHTCPKRKIETDYFLTRLKHVASGKVMILICKSRDSQIILNRPGQVSNIPASEIQQD